MKLYVPPEIQEKYDQYCQEDNYFAYEMSKLIQDPVRLGTQCGHLGYSSVFRTVNGNEFQIAYVRVYQTGVWR